MYTMKLPLKLNFHSHYEASKILLHFLLFYLFIYLFLSIPQCPLQIFLLKFSSSSSFYSFFLTRLIIFIIFFIPNGDECKIMWKQDKINERTHGFYRGSTIKPTSTISESFSYFTVLFSFTEFYLYIQGWGTESLQLFNPHLLS